MVLTQSHSAVSDALAMQYVGISFSGPFQIYSDKLLMKDSRERLHYNV